jgi:hypothetical protein
MRAKPQSQHDRQKMQREQNEVPSKRAIRYDLKFLFPLSFALSNFALVPVTLQFRLQLFTLPESASVSLCLWEGIYFSVVSRTLPL